MRLRSYISISTIAFSLIIALSSCEQPQNKKSGQVINNKDIQVDTSTTAVIPFNKKKNFPFDNSFNPSNLTPNDINNIDSILIACVAEYNNSLDNEHKEWGIDLKKYNYRKQLIIVTNNKSEKEVWVNCFCNIRNNNSWRTDILLVEDGGNCYFNFKINLATKKFYDFYVNSNA